MRMKIREENEEEEEEKKRNRKRTEITQQGIKKLSVNRVKKCVL